MKLDNKGDLERYDHNYSGMVVAKSGKWVKYKDVDRLIVDVVMGILKRAEEPQREKVVIKGNDALIGEQNLD